MSILLQAARVINSVLPNMKDSDVLNTSKCSLIADSTDSLKRSEAPPLVESANQQHKTCPKSLVVPRLEEPNVIGGNRYLLFFFQ